MGGQYCLILIGISFHSLLKTQQDLFCFIIFGPVVLPKSHGYVVEVFRPNMCYIRRGTEITEPFLVLYILDKHKKRLANHLLESLKTNTVLQLLTNYAHISWRMLMPQRFSRARTSGV